MMAETSDSVSRPGFACQFRLDGYALLRIPNEEKASCMMPLLFLNGDFAIDAAG